MITLKQFGIAIIFMLIGIVIGMSIGVMIMTAELQECKEHNSKTIYHENNSKTVQRTKGLGRLS